MRGIKEDELIEVRKSLASEGLNTDAVDALITLKVRELQPWIPIDEFLRCGHTGWCWIVQITREPATLAYFDLDGVFSGTSGLIVFNKEFITHVMPIHKPEPPK